MPSDLVRVNVYNKGRLPGTNVYGPLYATTVPRELFERLISNENIRVDELDFFNFKKVVKRYNVTESEKKSQEEKEKNERLERIKKAKEEADAAKALEAEVSERIEDEKPVVSSEAASGPENLVMARENLETRFSVEVNQPVSQEEAEMDKQIEALGDYDASDDIPFDMKKVQEDLKATEVVRYTKKKLEGMTKAQMKQILINRGYTEGEFAPKYHDTLDKLKAKILKTQ